MYAFIPKGSRPFSFIHGRTSLLIAACLGSASSHAAEVQFHVAPDGSGTACNASAPCGLGQIQAIVRARTSAMTEANASSVIVNLRPGIYELTDTFKLTDKDSGVHGYAVIYRPDPAVQGTVVFQGGKAITGWSYDPVLQLWKATLPEGIQHFRQLYVNGQRAVRARWPNTADEPFPRYNRSLYKIAVKVPSNGSNPTRVPTWSTFVVNGADLPPATANNDKVELVWNAHFLQRRAHVTGFTPLPDGTWQVDLNAVQSNAHYFGHQAQLNAPYFYENAREFIDVGGEWYADMQTRQIYYKPRDSQRMDGPDAVQIIAPQLETLVSIAGSSESSPIRFLHFKGVTLKYSNWTMPSDRGYLGNQAGLWLEQYKNTAYPDAMAPGALVVRNAEHVTIAGNSITATGAHGILLTGKLKRHRVVNNKLFDLAGGGIYEASGTYELASASKCGMSQSHYGTISGNSVQRAGRDYMDTVGIFVSTADHMSIDYNDVRQVPYSGISMGWCWQLQDTGARDNVIQHNRVHQAMQLLDDGAGIYTLGSMPNTYIQHNHVSDLFLSETSDTYPAAGIYLDAGSRGKVVRDNVLENTQAFNVNPDRTYDPALPNRFPGNIYKGTKGALAQAEEDPAQPNVYEANLYGNATSYARILAAGLIRNAAYRRPTSSSTQWSATTFHDEYAVDGSLDEQGWSSAKIEAGQQPVYNWWQVDLGAPARIAKLEIVSRFGPESLARQPVLRKNFKVLGSNDPNMLNAKELAIQGDNGNDDDTSPFPFRGTWSAIPKEGAAFQYVRIVKTQPEYFYLNEVRVFTRKP